MNSRNIGMHIISRRHVGLTDELTDAKCGPQRESGNVTEKGGAGLSGLLAFLTGMVVQISIPLTNLFDIPNVRAIFFAIILGLFVLQFLSGKAIQVGSFLLLSYLGLSVVLAVGIIYSRAPTYGANKVVLVSSYFWLLGTVIYNLVDKLSVGRAFLSGLFVGGLILVGVTAMEFGNPIQTFQRASRFFRLRFGDEGNPIMLARHLALAITTVIIYVALRRKWIDLLWSTPLILLTFAYLVSTGSKGPLLGLILSCVITAMLFIKGIVARLSLTLCIMAIVLVIVIGGLELLPKAFVEERFTEKVQNLSLRLPAYTEVVRTLLRSDATSLLVGHGTGDYGYFALGHDGRAYPHNVVLEVAYENGMIGVAQLIAALSYPLVTVFRRTKRPLEHSHRVLLAGLSAIYISSVINAQFTGDLGANLLIGMFGAATTSVSLIGSSGEGT